MLVQRVRSLKETIIDRRLAVARVLGGQIIVLARRIKGCPTEEEVVGVRLVADSARHVRSSPPRSSPPPEGAAQKGSQNRSGYQNEKEGWDLVGGEVRVLYTLPVV